jgi:S1-C subfamily serine protease
MRFFRHTRILLVCAVIFILVLLFAVGYLFFDGGYVSKEVLSEDVSGQDDFVLQASKPNIDAITFENTTLQLADSEKNNISLYEMYNTAVVNITTETVGYNWFLEPIPQEGSSGSGSIIDKRGYILTNHHVIRKATKVFVALADNSQVEGTVIGIDSENDLAIVKFDPAGRDLTTIPLGESGPLKVGQKVLAIGNPFALERTLTTGIVSGLGRPLKSSNGLIIKDMIQTDASINPGNSGGPLLDSSGKMIGINTMIFSPSGGSVGVGFAVPVDTAKRVVADLLQFGFVKRGWIDISPVQIFPRLVQYANLPTHTGILVSDVKPGGSAEKAGIRGGRKQRAVRYDNTVIYLGGDIIRKINEDEITTLADLYGALEDSRPGEKVAVTVIRGRREMTLPVILAERPEQFR